MEAAYLVCERGENRIVTDTFSLLFMAVCAGRLIPVVISRTFSLAEKYFRQGKDWKIYSFLSNDRIDPTSKCLDQSSRCLQDQAVHSVADAPTATLHSRHEIRQSTRNHSVFNIEFRWIDEIKSSEWRIVTLRELLVTQRLKTTAFLWSVCGGRNTETAHIIFEGKSLVLYYNKSSNLFSQYFPISSSSRDNIL